ncbi:sporulation related protein [Pacificibacter maritimus]|uniref:Sporulation related protein n=1 Tax=Pacificibacter maritimus TaxID=762213 RepID=A0A3N4VFE5_9RHOB|nr:SPOR domain-containing protein [Pacificibacter maritimus]RPE71644.1 sporulation related protein [Pacificibacter maritimus]
MAQDFSRRAQQGYAPRVSAPVRSPNERAYGSQYAQTSAPQAAQHPTGQPDWGYDPRGQAHDVHASQVHPDYAHQQQSDAAQPQSYMGADVNSADLDFGLGQPQSVPLGVYGSAPLKQMSASSSYPSAGHQAPPGMSYDANGNGYSDDGTLRPQLGAAQWGGAVVSLALMLGLGIWGYQLMMRDVSGVPVIRDMSADARSIPSDPGGQLAMHQGLAVNSVTADGSAAAPADQLTLAPRPMVLADEDAPMGAAMAVVSAYQPDNAYTQSEIPASSPLADQIDTAAIDQADLAEPADSAMTLDNVEDVAADMALLSQIDAEADAETDVETLGAVTQSPMPRARPVRLASLAAPAATTPTVQTDASLDGVADDILAALGQEGEISADEVPEGSRLVQFGAFQSEEIARSEWDRLALKFDALMDGKTRVIEKAQAGGKTFYRLRALGFADAADSNRFCAAMTARNAACVPARQR